MKSIISLILIINLGLSAQPFGNWHETDSLEIPRQDHAAIVLPNGNVLVTGGDYEGTVLKSTEIFNTVTEEWFPGPDMLTEKILHDMLLIDQENVLIIGAFRSRKCEIYNINTNSFSEVDSTAVPRISEYSAIKLLDGRVLLTGGFNFNINRTEHYKIAELFDPNTMQWTVVDSMNYIKSGHSSCLLQDGRVLVTGGNWNVAEIYDPLVDEWNIVAPMNSPRNGHQSLLLPDGRVFVAGGGDLDCEVYDPQSNTWTYTGQLELPGGDSYWKIFPMNDSLLFIHSNEGTEVFDFKKMESIYHEVYSPAERYNQVRVQLKDGSVLLTGGVRVEGIALMSNDETYIFNSNLITSSNSENYKLNSFLLHQNYPNPFNPSTKISWQSPVSSNQSLKIYDVLGNEVATLVNEYKPAGNYDVEFNGHSDAGQNLSSGIYFYQLRAGSYIETRKMVLQK